MSKLKRISVPAAYNVWERSVGVFCIAVQCAKSFRRKESQIFFLFDEVSREERKDCIMRILIREKSSHSDCWDDRARMAETISNNVSVWNRWTAKGQITVKHLFTDARTSVSD